MLLQARVVRSPQERAQDERVRCLARLSQRVPSRNGLAMTVRGSSYPTSKGALWDRHPSGAVAIRFPRGTSVTGAGVHEWPRDLSPYDITGR